MNRIRGAEQLDRFYPGGGGKVTDPGIAAETAGEMGQQGDQKFQIIDQQPDFFPVKILCDRLAKFKLPLAAGDQDRFAAVDTPFRHSMELFRLPHFCFPARTRDQQDQSFRTGQIQFCQYFFLII